MASIIYQILKEKILDKKQINIFLSMKNLDLIV